MQTRGFILVPMPKAVSSEAHTPSDDARRRVRCFVEDGVGLVTVKVSAEDEVGGVKRFVRGECMNSLLCNVDARDLAL